MQKATYLVIALLVFAITGGFAQNVIGSDLQQALDNDRGGEYRVIVELNEQFDAQQMRSSARGTQQEIKARVLETLQTKSKASQRAIQNFLSNQRNVKDINAFSLVNAISLVTNAETIRDLANRSDVKGIYLDAEQVMVAPLQAERTLAWGVEYIRADQAKQSTGDLRVAVIDTGVDLDHPGFEQGQVLSNLAKSFVSTEPTADDGHGHGTHCAGTIGSANYGVAPGVYIVPVKVLSKYGSGTWTAVMNGVEYGTQNANVCSMSLGGKASSSGNVVETAVKNGIAAGTVFVIAAGNSGSASGTIGTPGVVVEAITVGAISNNGVIAYFSSRGPTVYGDSKPDIVAPGVNVPSLWKNGGTNTISGTSMATPHVAGLCALILGKNDSLSPAQVKSILMQTAKGESGENVYGDGCIDALDALTNTLMARSQRSSDFTKTVVVTTDANGAVSKTVEIDAVMSVTMTHIQSDWSGTKNNFTNVTANLDKDTIFNGPVNNGQKYSVNKSVSSGKHTVVVTGEGGPANTEVTVTIYLSLW